MELSIVCLSVSIHSCMWQIFCYFIVVVLFRLARRTIIIIPVLNNACCACSSKTETEKNPNTLVALHRNVIYIPIFDRIYWMRTCFESIFLVCLPDFAEKEIYFHFKKMKNWYQIGGEVESLILFCLFTGRVNCMLIAVRFSCCFRYIIYKKRDGKQRKRS